MELPHELSMLPKHPIKSRWVAETLVNLQRIGKEIVGMFASLAEWSQHKLENMRTCWPELESKGVLPTKLP